VGRRRCTVTHGEKTGLGELLTRFQSDAIRVEPSSKWIRGVLAGEIVVNTRRAVLLWLKQGVPAYYFPKEDIHMALLSKGEGSIQCPYRGAAVVWDIVAAGIKRESAALEFVEPVAGGPGLRGYMTFRWDAMDSWFEEDEEVFVHARDPYKRIDVLQSSRHVQVVMDKITVAESHRPVLLFETGLPTRYYLPKTDVRMALLVPSDTVTRCPYKGEARYYTLKVGDKTHKDLVWYYRYPLPEVGKIAGHLCFYNERVDALLVDGQEVPKPKTRWSQEP
jgi:uncharacterized protein (DUF427 family)